MSGNRKLSLSNPNKIISLGTMLEYLIYKGKQLTLKLFISKYTEMWTT